MPVPKLPILILLNSVADPGCFFPDPDQNIFLIPAPGSYIKIRMKNKTKFFTTIYGFQVQVLVVLIDIRTIEYRIISPKYVPDPRFGIRKNSSWISIPIQEPGV
jgi:hypothetical protein